jgi:hypothetical protein
MSKKAAEGWTGRNKLPPPQIPPYKAPRLVSVKDTRKTIKKPTVVHISETEEKDSESEEDTQFGVVWEKMTEEQRTMVDNAKKIKEAPTLTPIEYVGQPWREKTYPKFLIPETEETDRQSSDKEEDSIPFSQIQARKDDVTSGEACVGKTVMKQFVEGLFKGKVVTAIKKRGSFLYHVVYEDGDEEDLNDQEFDEAYALYLSEKDKTGKAVHTQEAKEDSENEIDKSGGETEGSEYDLSEDEDEKQRRKKRRTTRDIKIKEKAKMGGKKKQKEEDSQSGKRSVIIDVDALLKSGSKQSVTNKTLALMTPEEKSDIPGSAEKSFMKQAKRGMWETAIKVGKYMPCTLLFLAFFKKLYTSIKTKYTKLVVEAQLAHLHSLEGSCQ